MTIAFWSSVRQSGVTATLASVCVIWTEIYGERLTVTANHLSNDGILSCFLGEIKRENRERREFCYCFGEPEYFRRLHMQQKDTERLLKQGIRYLPMDGREEPDYFTGSGLSSVQKQTNPEEFLMIDVAAGENQSSINLLNQVDILVCVLPKEIESTDHFLLSFSWNLNQCFFILPKKKKSKGYSKNKFCTKYHIPKKQVAEVWYHEEFALTVWKGQLVPHLRSGIRCVGENQWEKPKEEWVKSLMETAVLLRKFADERRKTDA